MRIWIVLLAAACCSMAEAEDKKPETIDGKWEWKYKMPDGKDATVHLKLKHENGRLSGVFVSREGVESAVENGRFAEGQASFDVTREIDGEKRLFKYSGTVKGDTLTGKIDFIKDGKSRPRDWEAQRVKE